jgi:hypothetical protein
MRNFKEIVDKFIDLGNLTITFLAVLALLVFALSVGRFIRSTESGKTEKTRNLLIWGVVGLFVLVSVWGIVVLVRREFGWTGDLALPLLKP